MKGETENQGWKDHLLRNISSPGRVYKSGSKFGQGEDKMVMRVENERKIETLGRHSAESVDRLRQLLAGGARVIRDPKRPDFYEVESGAEVYYIYVSPVTGKILLLATWSNDAIGTPNNVHQAA